MNNNLDIEQVLEALARNFDVEDYDVVHGIIELLEYHGFSKELVLQLAGDVYLTELQYQKAIDMYESAIKLHKKQHRTEEVGLLESHIAYIKERHCIQR